MNNFASLLSAALICATAVAADPENANGSSSGGVPADIQWHPLLLKGPVEIKDGQILSGTSGTIGGERQPASNDDRSQPFNDW